MISEYIAAALLILGALFMVIASIGLLRFSDFYLRMHAATKAPSLGVFLMVAGLMVYFQDGLLTLKGVLIVLFIFVTTPVGAHMLSRVAHLMKIKMSEKTQIDELTEAEQKLPGRQKIEK